MENNLYIKISGYEDYLYRKSDMTVWKNDDGDSKCCLFDLHPMFGNDDDYQKFPLETRIEIAKRMISAYEMGIEKEKKRITSHIHQLFELER